MASSRAALLKSRVEMLQLLKRFSHPDMFANVPKWPAAARIKHRTVAESEKGFYEPYRADYTRDTRYPEGAIPGMHGQTTWRFIKTTFKRNHELYPLFAAIGAWFCACTFMIIWSFGKREVVINRTSKINCTDWSKEREHYNKWPMHLNGQMKGVRLPRELEILQDELLEAAKARGTR